MPPLTASSPFAVIVMGVSGCGKSTLGALLAEALCCPFLEGDDFHSPASVAKMRGGEPLDDADRWPWLKRLGNATAAAVAEHGAAVTACSALRRCYRDHLRETIGWPVQLVLLENSREQLIDRLAARTGHFMPLSLVDSQLATLERPQTDEDALALVTDVAVGALLDEILARLHGN